jgi:hypothetical protein
MTKNKTKKYTELFDKLYVDSPVDIKVAKLKQLSIWQRLCNVLVKQSKHPCAKD